MKLLPEFERWAKNRTTEFEDSQSLTVLRKGYEEIPETVYNCIQLEVTQRPFDFHESYSPRPYDPAKPWFIVGLTDWSVNDSGKGFRNHCPRCLPWSGWIQILAEFDNTTIVQSENPSVPASTFGDCLFKRDEVLEGVQQLNESENSIAHAAVEEEPNGEKELWHYWYCEWAELDFSMEQEYYEGKLKDVVVDDFSSFVHKKLLPAIRMEYIKVWDEHGKELKDIALGDDLNQEVIITFKPNALMQKMGHLSSDVFEDHCGSMEENGWTLRDVLTFISKPSHKIHLTFRNPHLCSNKHYKVVVESSLIIGDVINRIPFLDDVKALIVRCNNETKHLGYDFNLSKPFSAYPEAFQSGTVVFSAGHLNPHQAQWQIKYPLMYFNKNKQWPPENAVNWEEGDPINLAPFLVWLGWGSGSTEAPDKKEDNRWTSLMVLKYPNGVAKVVNKFAWLHGSNNGKKDPLTNQYTDSVKTFDFGECLPVLELEF